jgi:sterol desaturase/sphingolipid hydroxylase (fatty acid hydroxylase superfamily)
MNYDLALLPDFLLVTVLLFALIIGRYLLIAGFFHVWCYIWRKEQFAKRKLGNKPYTKAQYRREFTYSMITAGIFAVTGALTVLLWQKGYTKVYEDPMAYGWWYLPVSLGIYLLAHETYYYWLHRWMHIPGIFKIVHKVHHQSTITSAWTAFSFHPLEGLLQAFFLPVMILFVPVHYGVLLFQLVIMTFSSVINHLDIELYPAKFHRHPVGKWLIGATHHSLHHKQFKFNYGLYFTFWDKWKGTESPEFEKRFESVTENTPTLIVREKTK